MHGWAPPERPHAHRRRLPVGAEVQPGGGVHFRVWAPDHRAVTVALGDGPEAPLAAEPGGYFSGLVETAASGTRYRYRLDGADALPDPASRFQPEGPDGPSEVVDPGAFAWTDAAWKGVPREGQVLYEMHVGTFTREGTWAAATRELPALADLGVTVIAHALGLGVILDVVYNHVGPSGNYLTRFSEDYFTDRYETEWGDPINFDGPSAGPVREFYLANAAYWIEEFHLDGLRLDATQNVYDASEDHILAAITRRVREAAGGRATLIVAENEPQDTRLLRPPEQGGFGMDAAWNDDFHHSAMVALTGRREAYFTDYLGTPQELISSVKRGFLYQGQHYAWQKQPRGTSTRGLHPAAFVTFLQNHDQVANTGMGERLDRLTSPGRLRAMTALLLLGPGTPMLFQGQEFAASTPWRYFADHDGELAEAVRKGRGEFVSQFPSLATPEMQATLPDPSDRATFEQCRLDLSERERHAPIYRLHRDLLRLRREDPVFRTQAQAGIDGAVLGPEAFALRFFAEDGRDRLLLVNLGRDLELPVIPEPLLAPPEGLAWHLHWSSEHPDYGGTGTAPVEQHGPWRLPAHSAVVLTPAQSQ